MNRSVSLSPIIKRLLPDCRLGLVESKVTCHPVGAEFEAMLEQKLLLAKQSLELNKENTLSVISESRSAYKICGKEPSRYRPSAESLLRRIRTGKGLYRINNIVDTINILSFTSYFSIGGFHMDSIEGSIELEVGDSNPYAAIGRGELNIEFMPGLKDEIGFFGTPTSDSERTMVRPTTENLLLVYYDFGGNDTLEDAMNNAAHLLTKYCNGTDVKLSIIK